MKRVLALPLLLLLLAGCTASAGPLAAPIAGGSSSGSGATQVSAASAGAFQPGATRSNSGGAVNLAATVQEPDLAGELKFKISMNTHSVGLDGYDLARLAVLRNSRGQEVRPTRWQAPAGGHHRSGSLAFPAQDAGGTAMVEPGVGYVELVVRGVAGVEERVLRWEITA